MLSIRAPTNAARFRLYDPYRLNRLPDVPGVFASRRRRTFASAETFALSDRRASNRPKYVCVLPPEA